MPKEKGNFRLVANQSNDNEDPAGLRLAKTIRGGGESTYGTNVSLYPETPDE